MIPLFTSNFARLARLRAARITPVSIARWPPRWYVGPRYIKLAPTAAMLRGDDDYDEGWEAILSRLDPEAVVADLEALAGPGSRGVCLLCWCASGEEGCHRRRAARWLSEHQGIIVSEWTGGSSKGGAV